MSIDTIAAAHSAEARVDAAYSRLADALALDEPAGSATPDQVERGHAAVGAARAALAEAEAAASAAQGASAPVAPAQNDAAESHGHDHAHLVELVA